MTAFDFYKIEKLFDKISDWTRFAIIIPNYESAPAILGSFLGEFGGEMTCHNPMVGDMMKMLGISW